jgi:hypothetical protein
MTCSKTARQRKRPRVHPLRPPELASRVLYAEIPRHRIALYRFLIEGYDNLAIMSVVDRYRAVIKLRFLADAEPTLRGLLLAEGARLIEAPGRINASRPDETIIIDTENRRKEV